MGFGTGVEERIVKLVLSASTSWSDMLSLSFGIRCVFLDKSIDDVTEHSLEF